MPPPPAPPDRTALAVLTALEMREWERRCFSPGGVQERVVLESAGRAVASAVAHLFPRGRVVGVVGSGNNGGDAIVALRTLHAWGREVAVLAVEGAEIRTDLTHGHTIPPVTELREGTGSSGVILDGILGTGATGAPREAQARAIREINDTGCPVVAIDGPSGVDLTTGRVAGEAVAAQVTVTFGMVKRGLLLHPGRELAGRILLAEVGFPPFDGAPAAALLTDAWAAAHLPRIAPDAHKSSAGLVGIVAGRQGVAGAAIMAAMGALRAGSGGVRLVSAEANRVAIQAAVPEAVFVDVESPARNSELERVSALLLGPGMGTDDAAMALLRETLERHPRPAVLDADALTLLARDSTALSAGRAASCVLTPHPGELARLLDTATSDVLDDLFAAAAAASRRYGCVVLAKGAPSLVAAPDRPTLVGTAGHSGVATGGMGDTLAGILAAFLAGGAEPYAAAGAALHFAGRAAERAGRGRGLLPRDVADSLPTVLPEVGIPPAGPPDPFLLDLPAPQ